MRPVGNKFAQTTITDRTKYRFRSMAMEFGFRPVLVLLCTFILGLLSGRFLDSFSDQVPGGSVQPLHASRLSGSSLNVVSRYRDLPPQKLRTRVVVFVPTPIEAVQRRDYVYRQFLREKWDPSDAVMVFVVGSKTGPRLEEDLNLKSIYDEQKRTGMSILVTPCRDMGDEVNNANGTSSTTCKAYEAVKYVYDTYEAEYCFRGADDAYVNLRKFFSVVADFPPQRDTWWMGRLRIPNDPHRHFDMMVGRQPELFKLFGQYMFGQYMLGCGYVFTWNVAEHIAKWVIPPHQTNAEDVMVGMWLNPFRIEKIHDNFNFDYLDEMRKYNERSKQGILVHYVLTERDWNSIDDNGTFHASDGLEGTFPLPTLAALQPAPRRVRARP